MRVFCYDEYMQKYKTVEEFLDDLNEDKRSQIDTLRDLIFTAEPRLKERIKWNAPSYVFDGEDRITFNVMNKQGVVKILLHMGATRKEDRKGEPVMQDKSGLIEWISDIRGVITFNSIDDVTSNVTALKKIVRDWLAISSSV